MKSICDVQKFVEWREGNATNSAFFFRESMIMHWAMRSSFHFYIYFSWLSYHLIREVVLFFFSFSFTFVEFRAISLFMSGGSGNRFFLPCT